MKIFYPILIRAGQTALAVFFAHLGQAQIISPSAVEVNYGYRTRFQPNYEDPRALAEDWSLERHAEENANHIFGILVSPHIIESVALNSNEIAGVGAPKLPRNLRLQNAVRSQSSLPLNGQARASAHPFELSYEVKGRMILHKAAARRWLRRGYVDLPLPVDMKNLYREECTDAHYSGLGDYWYFYDPFREGCEDLSRAPLAKIVRIQISPLREQKIEAYPRLDLLRGDNGNGKLFSIYMATGFYESSTRSKDEGRVNYDESRKQLRENGFTEQVVDAHVNYPRHKFTKTVQIPGQKEMQIEVHTQLSDTGADSSNLSFAKFFKEAVENSDVFIYDGHSGLGSNLDIAYLESKAGPFQFRTGQRQIFFFNSCSSYSYYLAPFAAAKTRTTIDVLTNGLSSDFQSAVNTHKIFIEEILNPEANQKWIDILKKMEAPLPGSQSSYLLNVGGV